MKFQILFSSLSTIFLCLKSPFVDTGEVTFYQSTYFKSGFFYGYSKTYDVGKGNCTRLRNWSSYIRSVDTHKGCVKLWSGERCQEESTFLYPGIAHNDNLYQLRMAAYPGRSWADRVVSVSGCDSCNTSEFKCTFNDACIPKR